MPNHLPLPPELQHLIEKRESADRRSGKDRRTAKRDTLRGTAEPGSPDIGQERRSGKSRRKSSRRSSNR